MTTSVWVNARMILPSDYLVQAGTMARWVYLRPDRLVEVACVDNTLRTYHSDSAVLVRRSKERY